MKEKSQIEKKAEARQAELLSAALSGASNAGGHWLNVSGKGFPRLYPQGVSASPFNALFMALHSDNNGCKTNLFTLYSETKARGAAVREHEQGVPFLFYNWNKYVNRNNPNETIDRTAYLQLDEEHKAQFKGVHNREIRTLFNIDQTTLPYVDKPTYEDAIKQDGSVQERGYAEADNRRLRTRFNDFLLKMRDNLVPVRSDGSGVPHYETDKDAVYMPRQKDFEHYHDYMQEALRQIVSATGHQQRLAREGMVMKNGVAPSEDAVKQDGSVQERGYTEADNRRLRTRFNDFLLKMRDNLVPVRSDGSGVPHYETDKDAVYMPRQKDFEHYHDYVQEALRQIVSATGHQQRLAREGMVMKNGVAPSEDAVKYERLVVELASGIKMLELGLPARLSDASLKTVDYWCREFKENPCIMDALESDVNNALDVIRKAERGEKIEYATLRNRRQTTTMQEQMPKHYFVANEIRQHPDKAAKSIVLVIDREAKSADVILPAGASTEANNEIPGMNKGRIERALQKEAIEQVRFYNTDGALGYRPDDSYFNEKMVTLARLRNYTLEKLSTLDVSEAVRRANEVGFDAVQMIQDDKNRWALYIKPENKEGYSVYPDKEDVNRFFSTLKQAMDNIDKVRMELAHKYYALAEVKPDLKVDLFGSDTPEIDLNRIQHVAIFKTRQDGIQCVATIDGQKLQPRSVTPQQWQRMWVAEDRDGYKRHLAATLFADVLQKGQSVGEQKAEEQVQQQNETVAENRSEETNDENMSPKRQFWDNLKEKHPDALYLIRAGEVYRLYNEDAAKGADILGITMKKYPERGFSAFAEFPRTQLDSYLPKLVRAGERIAISEIELQDKRQDEQETHRGIHR